VREGSLFEQTDGHTYHKKMGVRQCDDVDESSGCPIVKR
jgi:hypothetical protein